jgi:hypothetical protein
MHGLFDGGHGAGLEDFWNEMMKHRGFAGGFLWALHDEGVVRTDSSNIIDLHGNNAPDGIVGPYREKEASYYTIKELWSPVYIDKKSIPENFTGKIEVENRYLYTNLSQCKFEWQLVGLSKPNDAGTKGKIIQKGFAKPLALPPGEKGRLNMSLPSNVNADVLYLRAYNAKGDTVCTWSWPLRSSEEIAKGAISISKTSPVFVREGALTIACDGITYRFDTATGFLQNVFNGKKEISFSDGPALAGVPLKLSGLKHYQQGDTYMIEPSYGETRFNVKWIFQSGQLPKLEYTYSQRGAADFMGITFNYPEEKIIGMKWIGRGPYRVWKNRLRGQQFGVWEKAYNNTITGETWVYPEFKGWHSEMYWVKVQNKESDFIVYTDRQNIFLQMLKPQRPKASFNENTHPPFPNGNIGFMNAISAIGTKFQAAELLGPQSQKNMEMNYTPITGTLYFDFR